MPETGLARNIDRRAARALDDLGSAFAVAAGAPKMRRISYWHRRIEPSRSELLDHVDIVYELKNRFWARIYDLTVSTSVVRDEALWPIPQVIRLQYGGFVRARGAYFVATRGECAGIAEALSAERDLADLVQRLNLTHIQVYAAESEDGVPVWRVDTTGLIGSYTWNFVPPIFQAIRYRESEVHAHLALLAMIAHILKDLGGAPSLLSKGIPDS